MGILNKDEWKALWIGMIPEDKNYEDEEERRRLSANGIPSAWSAGDEKGRRRLSARYLRKEIAVNKKVEKATVYICGLGYYKLSLNGQSIGDHVLDPILRDYDKQLPYNTYDISTQLQEGLNCIGVVLGNGRFFAPHLTVPTFTRTFGYPQLLFQMEIVYDDGSSETIISDESWKITDKGPIVYNNDYDGEYYDARMEMQNWDCAAFDDAKWHKPDIVDKPKGELTTAACMQPMRVTDTISPVSTKKLANGNWFFDLGQNIVGKYILKVKGEAGTKIRMHFAETTNQVGEPSYANLRDAECTDYFILKGNGKTEIYSPSFTYHGYRYVEIEGLPQPPDEGTFIAEVVHTDMPFAGDFDCSNQTINQILENARWGLRGNYLSIPTDCPQRDERQGWQGDRAAEQLGETFMFDNILLYEKWLDDIRDSQLDNGNLSDVCPAYWPLYNSNVTWPSAFLIIPGNLYLMYGDKRMIERHYQEMVQWMSHLRTKKVDGILACDNYGDWCCPPEDKYFIHSEQEWRKTPKELLATSYYYHNLNLMAQYAGILGNDDDVKVFKDEAKVILKAFNNKLYNKAVGFYGNGSQTSQILPLYFDMVPYDRKQQIFDYLINHIETKTNNHIGTGLIGGQWLMRTLSDFGKVDKAYQFATYKDYPSWGYMIENGATTIWELWNGNTANPAMNSGNHVMLLGDFMTWSYEYLAGIKADINNPGFKHIIMKPCIVGDLEYVNANFKSVAGEIVSNWKLKDDIFEWDIVIPAGSTATAYIPAQKVENVTENGTQLKQLDGIEILEKKGDRVLVKIGSGKYQFRSDGF